MKKIYAALVALLLTAAGCSTEIRIVSDPVTTSIESPFFGSLSGEDIYAELGINLAAARGVEVLSAFIRATVANHSTLGITVRVYVSMTGDPAALGRVRIHQTPPPGMVEDAWHRVLDTAIPAMNEQDILIDGSNHPVIGQAVGNGALWIHVHGHITGIALNPSIMLKNLIIDATIRKDMANFMPLVDLL